MDNEVKATLLAELDAATTPNQVLLVQQKIAAAKEADE